MSKEALPKEERMNQQLGLALILGTGASAVGLIILSAPFLIVPAISRLGGIPWMVTPQHIVEQDVRKLPPAPVKTLSSTTPSAHPRRRPILIDLGSGDGRLVIEAARRGYDGVGLELNPVLIAHSYFSAARAGVLPHVSFRMRDFWSESLNAYDAVSCFGVAPVMSKLEEKLNKEARQGTSVLCFRFPLPFRKPITRENELYFYKY